MAGRFRRQRREVHRQGVEGNRNGVAVELSVRDGEVFIDWTRRKPRRATYFLVAYLRTAVSPIGRGENAGRTLKEFNIVRGFHSLGR